MWLKLDSNSFQLVSKVDFKLISNSCWYHVGLNWLQVDLNWFQTDLELRLPPSWFQVDFKFISIWFVWLPINSSWFQVGFELMSSSCWFHGDLSCLQVDCLRFPFYCFWCPFISFWFPSNGCFCCWKRTATQIAGQIAVESLSNRTGKRWEKKIEKKNNWIPNRKHPNRRDLNSQDLKSPGLRVESPGLGPLRSI